MFARPINNKAVAKSTLRTQCSRQTLPILSPKMSLSLTKANAFVKLNHIPTSPRFPLPRSLRISHQPQNVASRP